MHFFVWEILNGRYYHQTSLDSVFSYMLQIVTFRGQVGNMHSQVTNCLSPINMKNGDVLQEYPKTGINSDEGRKDEI
jgi:hypothetical protein